MNVETHWSWPEATLVILFMGLVVFWDFQYQPSQRRALRLAAFLMAIGALVFMYLRPALHMEAPHVKGAVFTTPSDQTEKSDLLQNSHRVAIPKYSDPARLPYTFDKIEVHGDGLEPWELMRFEGYELEWSPSDLNEGITAIQVPEILEGVPFQITGNITANEELTLSLIDPEGKSIDQKLSPPDSVFEFKSEVKTAGLFLYKLLGSRGEDTVFLETLPVEVNPSRQANVLLLGSFPSFEWNYLKNHLGDLGFGVASKFQLSRDVSHTEFLNMPNLNLNMVNKKLLQSFKLVIMDAGAFGRLTNRQKREIYQAVELAEVGLFLMIDDFAELSAIATLNAVDGSGEVLVSTAQKQISLLKMPFSINDRKWEKLMFQDQEIGSFTSRGIGKIGFSMIANSHVLELQGASEVYGQLWDQLLSPIIGFDITADQFYVPRFNFIDRQTDISFSYFGQPRVSIDGQTVPPINSPLRPDLWTVSYWPEKQGWHAIQVDGEDKTYFFVHAPKDWEALQRFEKQRYNKLFFATNMVVSREGHLIEKPISPWISFIVFLLAVTGLWLERKLS